MSRQIKVIFSLIRAFSIIFLFYSPRILAENNCETSLRLVFEKIFDIEFRYREVFSTEIDPSKIFSDFKSTDLYIGFNGSHTYLVYNNERFDGGNFVSREGKYRHQVQYLHDGVVLRIKDFPHKPLLEELSAGESEFNLTCSQGVCSVLKRGGIRIPGFGNFIPSKMLKNIIRKGIYTQKGERLQTELYLLNREGLKKHFLTSRAAEALLAASFAAPFLGPLIVLQFIK